MYRITLLTLLIFISTQSHSIEKKSHGQTQNKLNKGLLPELKLEDDNEIENQKKLITSELMIQNSEIKAIDALKKIIERKRGTSEEPDLLFRLGEMHLKRARTQRNLDLAKSGKQDNAFKLEVRNALDVFTSIESKFPHFQNLDSVLFTHAFAANQVGLQQDSIRLYQKIFTQFPKSLFIPDVTLEMGEIYFNLQKYNLALEYFEKIENYPTASVYIYGKYKSAWTLYNLRRTKQGMEKLIEVANKSSGNDESRTKKEKTKHNLRKEALRDITIFASEVFESKDLYSFFKKISRDDELGPLLIELGKLYYSHSKYKEALVFLKEFTSKEENNSEVIYAKNIIIDALESLKERTQVIFHLEEASKLCQWSSQWRKSVPIEIANTSCSEFKELSYEISSKWWDIWLKNKNHKEFSNYTRQAFKVIVDNDDTKNPDLKAHYAYAELLFQLESFDEASSEYLFVGKRTEDPQIKHDANYSALFAKEKSLSKNNPDLYRKEIQDLSINYINSNPDGKYIEDVQFKMGISAYERNSLEEASRWLMPLMTQAKNREIRIKSQDLFLDSLNLKKEYHQLKEKAELFANDTSDPARKNKLTQIALESHYNQIQEELKEDPSVKNQEKLRKFITEHPQHELSKKSQWQLVGLLYKNKEVLQANESAIDYCQKYPKESQCLTVWQEVADKYIELKMHEKSILPLEKLIALDDKNKMKYSETLAQVLILSQQENAATSFIQKTLKEIKNNDQKKEFTIKIYPLILTEQKTKKNIFISLSNYLKKEILNFNIEPYSTQFLTETANELFNSQKNKEAFELTLKILKRDSSSSERAPARMIQAQILQQEFQQQSVKAKADRLATVLSIKTEKLDKAQQAFISVLNMSQDPLLIFSAMKGLETIYDHYADAVININLPSEISSSEQESLKKELQLLAQPIIDKSKDIKVKIQEFSKKYPIVLDQKSGLSLSLVPRTPPVLIFSYKFANLNNNLNQALHKNEF
ncbi:MAG TPA: outer membrane protein assembly factor BamD [Pseudobdellovibrionaceae bacterium]|nr:outer membrane protein assembly factor BamD [Pseudobdellovibrionaceae bacterium]